MTRLRFADGDEKLTCTRLVPKLVTDLRENLAIAISSPTPIAPTTSIRPNNRPIKTPKRQEILDRHYILHQKPSQIKEVTDVSTPTVRRVIKSGEPRRASRSHTDRPPKLNARDIRRLVRAVTSSADRR